MCIPPDCGAIGQPDGEGYRIEFGRRGRVRVVPDGSMYRLYADAANEEYAAELLELSRERLRELTRNIGTEDGSGDGVQVKNSDGRAE